MPIFIWKGTDRKGSKQNGEIDADNLVVAKQILARKGLNVTVLKPKPKDIMEYIPLMQPKVKEKDLVVFIRQLATMIDAGVPLIQCLEILEEQQVDKLFKRIIGRIQRDVEEGSTFSEALRKHPKTFDPLFVSLIAAGEVGGILDVILNRLATYIEKSAKLKREIKGAMTYPAVVIGIAILVVIVILVYVIPVFAQIFSSVGKSLPGPTVFVMNLSDFVKNYVHWMALAAFLAAIGAKRFRNTKRGRELTDRLFLRLPVFGILLKKVAVARFTRTLGTLLSSGIPILDSLDIVASTSGNTVIEKGIIKARAAISEGRTVAEPLSETKIFPVMVIQMIGVGESTGAMDAMLAKIADFYDEEVDTAVASLKSLIEPLLILFLGVVVGGLLVAMYLPIFQLSDAVGRG
jgi:type IV pilus assembly protein PilC